MAEPPSEEDTLVSFLREAFPENDVTQLLKILLSPEDIAGNEDTRKTSDTEEAPLDLWEQAKRRIQESELSDIDKERLQDSQVARTFSTRKRTPYAYILPRDGNRSYQDTSAVLEQEAPPTKTSNAKRPSKYQKSEKVLIPRRCLEALLEIDPDLIPKEVWSKLKDDGGEKIPIPPTESSSARGAPYTCNLCGATPKARHRCLFLKVPKEFWEKVVKAHPENAEVVPAD